MALACSGRGPLVVPPGLMRSACSSLDTAPCRVTRGTTDEATKKPRPSGTRIPRGTTLVDAASRHIHSRRSLVRHSVFGYCAAPTVWGKRAVRLSRSGASSSCLLHRAHTYPRLSEQRGNCFGPRHRVQYLVFVAAECTGHSGLLSTRRVKTAETRSRGRLCPSAGYASTSSSLRPRAWSLRRGTRGSSRLPSGCGSRA